MHEQEHVSSAASMDATTASMCELDSSAAGDLGRLAKAKPLKAAEQENVKAAAALDISSAISACELGSTAGCEIATPSAVIAGCEIQSGGTLIYRVTQGVLFVKRAENPNSQKVLKLKRPVGAFVHSTGYTWTGSAGGVWAELEASKGEMGWTLVRGPGFGLQGPALIDAMDLLNATSLQIVLADEEPGVIFESWVRRDMTVLELKKAVVEATGLTQKYCCLIKDPPGKIPGTNEHLTADYCEELKDDSTLLSIGCGETTQLFLMYLGSLPRGFRMPKPLKN